MDFNEKELLEQVPGNNNELKEFLVNYVGSKHNNPDDNVTVEMIVETMATDFPEFLLAVAEENWVRGYQQALNDVDYGMKIANENKT